MLTRITDMLTKFLQLGDNVLSKFLKKPENISTSTEAGNVYLLMDDFTPATIKPVIEWILNKNFLPSSQRPEYLTLIINSPGGDLTSAFALIDVMKGSVIPVRTLGIGSVCSCGLLTLIAGAKGHRTITPMTSILSHQFFSFSVGKNHELLSQVREFELTEERMMTLYKHCTGLSEKKIREVLLPPTDVWLSAEEALDLGLVDSIKATF
jgi:ATP-dependent Clp protease, protease subunit